MPSWKIQTSAPKLALIDSSVMITALIGMTTEPNSRNRITALASEGQPDGVRRPLGLGGEEVVASGGVPPTWRRDAGAGIERADDRDQVASRRAATARAG